MKINDIAKNKVDYFDEIVNEMIKNKADKLTVEFDDETKEVSIDELVEELGAEDAMEYLILSNDEPKKRANVVPVHTCDYGEAYDEVLRSYSPGDLIWMMVEAGKPYIVIEMLRPIKYCEKYNEYYDEECGEEEVPASELIGVEDIVQYFKEEILKKQ